MDTEECAEQEENTPRQSYRKRRDWWRLITTRHTPTPSLDALLSVPGDSIPQWDPIGSHRILREPMGFCRKPSESHSKNIGFRGTDLQSDPRCRIPVRNRQVESYRNQYTTTCNVKPSYNQELSTANIMTSKTTIQILTSSESIIPTFR